MVVMHYVLAILLISDVYAHTPCPKDNNDLPGLPVPPDECVLPWTDFQTYAASRSYVAAYKLDTTGRLSDFAVKIRIDVLPDGRISVKSGTWRGGPSSGCQKFDNLYPKICGDKADLPLTTNGDNFPFLHLNLRNRTTVFLSCSPELYYLFYFCVDAEEIVCGKCPNVFVVLFVRDHRVDADGDGIVDGDPDFTGVPWGRIEKFSKHCLGETFHNNDDLGWKWMGRRQPIPCPLE